MLSPFVAKLLKQVDSWQSEAEHSRLPSPQSTLTDSERLDAHDSNGDSRDIILEVRANLAKSQQEHADRMARIRQDYTDGITRIEADRKFKTKPAHAATAPTGQRRISWGEHTFKSGKSAPMQRRASADVRGQRLEPTFSANTAVHSGAYIHLISAQQNLSPRLACEHLTLASPGPNLSARAAAEQHPHPPRHPACLPAQSQHAAARPTHAGRRRGAAGLGGAAEVYTVAVPGLRIGGQHLGRPCLLCVFSRQPPGLYQGAACRPLRQPRSARFRAP